MVLVGAVRMTGALRVFRLEYIIFFRGGGILHYWMILREGGVGALGWCGWIGGGGNIQRLSESLRFRIPAFAGMTGCNFLFRRGWIPVFTGMTKFQTALPSVIPACVGMTVGDQRKKSPTPGGRPWVNAPIVLFAVSSALPRADLRAARMRSSSISLSSAAS